MLEKLYEGWITWVYGGPWLIRFRGVILFSHKSGIVCHIHAIYLALTKMKPYEVSTDFKTRSREKHQSWNYYWHHE